MYIRKNRMYIRPKSYVDIKIACRDFVQCDVVKKEEEDKKTQGEKARSKE